MIFTSLAMGINDLHSQASEAQKLIVSFCFAGSHTEDKPNFSLAKKSNITVNGVASMK